MRISTEPGDPGYHPQAQHAEVRLDGVRLHDIFRDAAGPCTLIYADEDAREVCIDFGTHYSTRYDCWIEGQEYVKRGRVEIVLP